MSVKLLTEHHLKFLSLKVGCTGSSESTHVKILNCWKSHVTAQIFSHSYLVGLRGIHFGLSFHLSVSFVCVSDKGSRNSV